MAGNSWNTTNLSAPVLDWATFQRYIAPTLYSGDARGTLGRRDQWSNQLGWDVGGKGNFRIEGLDREKFFRDKVGRAYNGGYGESAGEDTQWNADYAAALSNPENQKEWRALVEKALKDPNTVYNVVGDRLTNVDGSAATNEGARRQVRYTLKDGKLVPIAQNDWDTASSWNELRDGGIIPAAALLAGGYLAEGALAGGAAGGAGGGAGGTVGGTGLSVTPGSGLSLGSAGASGTGLSATTGSGLTLAGTTGTGAGLATGTGAGVIGSGIGATIPTGAVISEGLSGATGGAGGAGAGAGAGGSAGGAVTPTAGNATNPALIESAVNTPGYGASSAGAGLNAGGTIAGGSTLPTWLTDTLKRYGGNQLVSAVLGGLAGGAAAGGGSVDTGSQQGIAKTLGDLGLEQAGIARDQYEEALRRIAANDPKFDEILSNALGISKDARDRADVTWDSYASNFLPAAEKFAQTAMNYDTPGRRMEEEARARAGVEADAAMQQQAQQRMLNRAGISLDSGRALTLDNQRRLETTKVSTGAADAARRNVETTGLNLLNTTANLGQGIVNTSQGYGNQSLTGGNAASATLGTKEATRNATLAPTQAFYGGATSSLGSAGNVLNQVANINQQNDARRDAGWAGLGQLAGMVLTAPNNSIVGNWFTSDPRSKQVNGEVDDEDALEQVEGDEVYDYTYKPGMGDGGRHIGRMAGPEDPTGPDGMRRISVQDELGKHTAAIRQVARQVKSLGAEVAKMQRVMSLGDMEVA